jgi:hypothetical protein
VTSVLAQTDVEAEIIRISALCERVTEQVAERARAAAKADALYRKRHAQAFLTAEGRTIPDRQAAALLECIEEYDHHRHADAVLMAAQEAGRNYRAQLDALRSINANLRPLVS